jgi:hypothetical protein
MVDILGIDVSFRRTNCIIPGSTILYQNDKYHIIAISDMVPLFSLMGWIDLRRKISLATVGQSTRV